MNLSKQGDKRPSLFRDRRGGFLSRSDPEHERSSDNEAHAMEKQEKE